MANKLDIIPPDDLLTEIDNWRRGQPVIPSRAAAGRELIWFGLLWARRFAESLDQAETLEKGP